MDQTEFGGSIYMSPAKDDNMLHFMYLLFDRLQILVLNYRATIKHESKYKLALLQIDISFA